MCSFIEIKKSLASQECYFSVIGFLCLPITQRNDLYNQPNIRINPFFSQIIQHFVKSYQKGSLFN